MLVNSGTWLLHFFRPVSSWSSQTLCKTRFGPSTKTFQTVLLMNSYWDSYRSITNPGPIGLQAGIFTTWKKWSSHVPEFTDIHYHSYLVSLLFAAPIPTLVIFMKFLPLVTINATDNAESSHACMHECRYAAEKHHGIHNAQHVSLCVNLVQPAWSQYIWWKYMRKLCSHVRISLMMKKNDEYIAAKNSVEGTQRT